MMLMPTLPKTPSRPRAGHYSRRPQREAPMERYIGMDVHAASCTLAVISEKGRKLKDFPETGG